MQRIERELRKAIGLDAASIGSAIIERTVQRRMKRHGLKTAGEYLQLLQQTTGELDELVEAVVVTETWFFRDQTPFTAFVRAALQWLGEEQGAGSRERGAQTPSSLLQAPCSQPPALLRILSVPCSTGEEPYSLAIALLDAQVAPERFLIDAVDISNHALARAKQGIYGKNSFRGKDLGFRDRYFTKLDEGSLKIEAGGARILSSNSPLLSSMGEELGDRSSKTGRPSTPTSNLYFPTSASGGYELNQRVRTCVRFHRDNLLGDAFLKGHAPYDFIFCRNLLIYFDRATQDRALEKLSHLLQPGGLLFLGPAEQPLAAQHGFEHANLPMAFACRKPVSRSKAQGTGQPSCSPAPTTILNPTSPLAGGNPVRRVADGFSDLDAALQLADAGHLEEAAMVCQNHLRDRGPSAQVYYLLGLVSEAWSAHYGAGASATALPSCSLLAAPEYYRKALYLQPDHYETLLQMSLLLEKAGDAAGAVKLRSRLRRAAAQRTERGNEELK